MSYNYNKRTEQELEGLASVVLDKYSRRCSGNFIDIEGIIEDCGLRIIPREGGLRKFVEGYTANNPHYIIVPKVLMTYSPRYRPVIAEEFCHILLEWDILSAGLPDEAHAHALTQQQHREIETDARYLTAAILFPRDQFKSAFDACLKKETSSDCNRDICIRKCGDTLENRFQVWSLWVGYRARDLNLITIEECKRNFSNRLAF